MGTRWQRWGWTFGKALLALAILIAVGLQFSRDLHALDPDEVTFRPGLLVLSGVLYLLGLGFSAGFWYRLLYLFGEHPAASATVRAYYLGHLGKYIPGKALALVMRGSLIRGPEVRLSVAVLTAFYEVLTTMAAGALLSAVLLALQGNLAVEEQHTALGWHPVLLGGLLLCLLGVPLLPGVFNLLVERLARRFQTVESLRLPRLRSAALLQGLLLTGCGWVLMGAGLWATLAAVLPEPPLLSAAWGRCLAALGLAYVAGFLVLVVPSGVGVREFVLLQLLGPDTPLIAVAVLVLRLVWTTAELVMAGVVYWLPGQRQPV
jgi:hypothetical protein